MPRNRRNRSRIALPEITLTPLIDTVLVLLIIFMMSMPVLQTYVPIDLPQASNASSAQATEPIYVHVDQQGQYYVNGEQVTHEQVQQAIEKALEETQDKGVIVYGDTHITYGTIVSLLDEVKAIHAAEYVALAADPKHT